MTQTVTTDGAVTADTEFPYPNVQAVFVQGRARQLVLLLSQSYTNQTANFSETTLQTARYRALHIVIEWVSATGTSPTLQVDLIDVLPDATRFDFTNQGPKSNTQSYNLGLGCATNMIVPEQFSLNYIIAGTTPSITFKVFIWGEV